MRILKNGIPAGTLLSFAGGTVPTGFLLCDGSTVSRAAYPALFAAIGVSHGSGDGATTFHLPDLRGRFVRGADNMGTGAAGRDPDAASRTASNAGGNTGNTIGSVQDSENKSHSHNFAVSYGSGGITGPKGNSGTGGGVQSGPTDPNGVSETRPQNSAAKFIIKA